MSLNTIASGRNALQKKILSLLRKIEHPTQGNKQAWYDTFVYQQTLTKLLQNYPKNNKNDDSASESSPVAASSSAVTALHSNRINKRNRNTSALSSVNSQIGSGTASTLSLSTSSYSNLNNFNSSNAFNSYSSVNSSGLMTSSSTGTINSNSISTMFSQEHDLEDVLAEWANMTGFLSALGIFLFFLNCLFIHLNILLWTLFTDGRTNNPKLWFGTSQ